MKKIGIVIADGVGYRNFVMSDFLKEINLEFDEVIIYSGLLKNVYNKLEINDIKIRELEIYNESKLSWFYRKLKEVGHLQQHNKYFGINCSLQNGNPKFLNSNRAKITKLIYFITKFLNNEQWITFFEKLQYNSFKKDKIFKSYVKLLKEDNPTHIFFTHQRPANLSPFLGAAKICKIKTSTFIFSWDNLSSKGRMLGTFDFFLVWSELMKNELTHFYKKVNIDTIKIIGTPQFEPYVLERYFKDINHFYKRFEMDKSKKTVYYSCGDVSTSKLDPFYIETIAKAILQNKINESINFIVRTSPAEDGTRFLDIKKKYPFIKWNFPKWNLTREYHTEIWSQRVPEFNDICDLRSLLAYSEVNINMCSTMSLDFMLFDKPVINAVFGNLKNGLYNDQKYLKYDHYKKVVESGAVTIAKNENELVQAINEAMENPEERATQRRAMIALQISKPLEGTSKRIAATLFHLYD